MKKYFITIVLFIFLVFSCDEVGKIIDEGIYQKPIIESLDLFPKMDINIKDTVMAVVKATNPEKGLLTYKWSDDPENSGRFIDPADRDTAYWVALSPGPATITVTVSNDEKKSKFKSLTVIDPVKPIVKILSPKEGEYIVQNYTVSVTGTADHGNNINHIRLFVNDSLKGQISVDKLSVDFSLSFIADSSMFGETTIRVDAESQQSGTTGADSVVVSIEGILPKRGGN